MDNNILIKVINDHFGEEPEVLEVAMYALSTLAVNDAILQGIMNQSTEIKGIPPESLHIMKRFDNGLTVNKFYLENFAPIKSALMMDDIKLNTMRNFVELGESKGLPEAFKQVRAILLSRMDVMTIIAFLWKGVQFAEEFDANFRLGMQLSSDHEKYFKSKGL